MSFPGLRIAGYHLSALILAIVAVLGVADLADRGAAGKSKRLTGRTGIDQTGE